MKKFLSLFISFLILFSLTACGEKTDVDVESGSKSSDLQSGENYGVFDKQETTENSAFTPYTVMDLFDGERRIWYFIDSKIAEDGLAYDNRVQSVFVTENKKVVEFYYNLGSFGKTDGYPDYIEVIPENTPCFSDLFMLSDFAGKNDDEILEMVRSTYADASKTYEFSVVYNYIQVEVTGSPFAACEMPYEIKYKGDLDASGNNLEYEWIKFIDKPYAITESSKYGSMKDEIENTVYFDGVVNPTIIKDKEYVGIKCVLDHYLITENTYASFDEIVYDSPDGASEW